MNVFRVDGIDYSNVVIVGVERTAEIRDTELSGIMTDGSYHRDLFGTYYNYTINLVVIKGKEAEYAALYQVLTAPVESHSVTVPYNNTIVTFTAYVKTVSDSLYRKSSNISVWKDITVDFIDVSPMRLPT
jgi:hypothetical protein